MKSDKMNTVGWREWLELPELSVKHIKAKVDTGARSSALHAIDLEVVHKRTRSLVRFKVHPLQDSSKETVACELPLHDERWVKSSNGKRELRPVVRTQVRWQEQTWDIDLTLTSRDMMGFRMLLGREALRRRLLVDPGRSFLGGRANTKAKAKAATVKKKAEARPSGSKRSA